MANTVSVRDPEVRLSQATALDWRQAATLAQTCSFHWFVTGLICDILCIIVLLYMELEYMQLM